MSVTWSHDNERGALRDIRLLTRPADDSPSAASGRRIDNVDDIWPLLEIAALLRERGRRLAEAGRRWM